MERTKANIVFATLFFLFGLGCTRQSDQSKLVIKLPDIQAASSNKTIIAQSASAASTNGPPWNSSYNPTNLSEINCYGVVVGGPEEFMRYNYAEDPSGVPKVYFGPWKIAVPGGQTISLDVPSGAARKIVLLGFKVPTISNCYDYRITDPIDGTISQPHILATVQKDLPPGDTSLTIKAVFDASKVLHEFEGPDFNDNLNNGPGSGSADPFTFGDGSDGNVGPLGNGTHNLAAGGFSIPYAMASFRVTNIDTATGTVLTVANDPTLSIGVGDEVFYVVTSAWKSGAPDLACHNTAPSDLFRGRHDFAKVTAVTATTITIDSSTTLYPGTINNAAISTNTIDRTVPFCRIQVVRVPQFNNLSINSAAGVVTLSTDSFGAGAGTGGFFVMKVNGTLSLVGANPIKFDMNGFGFQAVANTGGDGSEGIGLTGSSVNVGNGGGLGTAFGEAGGGGGNNGVGGLGGGASGGLGGTDQPFCSGGTHCTPAEKLFMGGGGGASMTIPGGAGGGVVLIFARTIDIQATTQLLANGAAGSLGTGDGGGGGGAGGTILMKAQTIIGTASGNLDLWADGGIGGNTSSGFSGGGGGGGATELQWCETQPSNASLVGKGLSAFASHALGGAPGAGGSGGGFAGTNGNGAQPGGIGDYSIYAPALCGI